MKNKSKSTILIALFIIICLYTTVANAVKSSFDFYPDGAGESATTISETITNEDGTEEVTEYIIPSFDFYPDGAGEFATTTISETITNKDGTEEVIEYIIMCAQKGGRLKPTQYAGGYKAPMGPYCSYSEHDGNNVQPPWTNGLYQSSYELKGTKDMSGNQDVAYALANSTDAEQAQKLVWSMSINQGTVLATDDPLYEEAMAYKAFYDKLQTRENFATDETDISKVKVAVNKDNDTYTVGPFKISYIDDYYMRKDGTKISFSEMSDLKVIGDNSKTLELIDIKDARGNSISSREYKYPTGGEEFYVTFKGNAKNINLALSFKYLKECSAKVYEYEGKIYEWRWYRRESGSEIHRIKDKYHSGYTDPITRRSSFWILDI